MENQWLGVAVGVIFYVTWSMVEYDSIEEELMEIEIPFYSHPETHKDTVGTALHIQEANIEDTIQTKTVTQNVLHPLHDYREMIEERKVSRDIGFYT
ncbi:hypothetical protein TNCV_3725151 [Trichonephila clavipes]|nr:hypothetical protein TNCV_3725151 [Trichonephila clavipes]